MYRLVLFKFKCCTYKVWIFTTNIQLHILMSSMCIKEDILVQFLMMSVTCEPSTFIVWNKQMCFELTKRCKTTCRGTGTSWILGRQAIFWKLSGIWKPSEIGLECSCKYNVTSVVKAAKLRFKRRLAPAPIFHLTFIWIYLFSFNSAFSIIRC